MPWDDDQTVLVEPEVLCEPHTPDQLLCRGEQIDQLVQAVSPPGLRQKPGHCWVCGRPGTGKTVAARHVLAKLQRDTGLRGLYVNCWEYPTHFSVLDRIVRQLRVLGADRLTVSFKLERLQRHLGNEAFLVVLDEIDQPVPKERHAILYNLSQLGNVGLLCLCNSEHVYFGLEDRVKSRLNPTRIVFPEYPEHDLVTILQQRADRALAEESWSGMTLRHIAHLSAGDARIAIQTLRSAAILANRARTRQIQLHHVHEAWNSAKHVKRSYVLRKLTDHHRLLYRLVAENPGILSGDLWRAYLKACSAQRTRPIALRTYSDYCNHLADVRLVETKRAAIQGKVREFRTLM